MCDSRNHEINWVFDYLIANGFVFTRDFKRADLVVLTTCAAVKENEKKTLRAIKYYYRKKAKHSKFLIFGCLPRINPTTLQGMSNVLCFSPRDLNKLDNFISPKRKLATIPRPGIIKYFPLTPILVLKNAFIRESQIFYHDIRTDFGTFVSCFKKLAFQRVVGFFNQYYLTKPTIIKSDCFYLKIGEGCSGYCSYCAIRFAIGHLRSRPKKAILADFKQALEEGHNKFSLLLEDVGSYGIDINSNIIVLLESIFKEPGEYELMPGGLNPKWLIRYYGDFAKLLENNFKRIHQLGITIESGSNKILQKMNRHYRIEEVIFCLQDIKRRIPKIEFGTSLIVGFPGETEEDFEKTIKLIRKIHFSDMIIHSYTNRPNTVASKMGNKIDKITVAKRVKRLMKIQKEYGQSRWIF